MRSPQIAAILLICQCMCVSKRGLFLDMVTEEKNIPIPDLLEKEDIVGRVPSSQLARPRKVNVIPRSSQTSNYTLLLMILTQFRYQLPQDLGLLTLQAYLRDET